MIHRSILFAVGLLPLVAACSGPTPPPDDPSNVDTSTDTSSETNDTPPPATSKPKGGVASLNPEQREMLELVLARGERYAKDCANSVPGGKGGKGDLEILFDGKVGKITEVTVGAPWAGTAMEPCIKKSWVGQMFVPFEGDSLAVPYELTIPEPTAAKPDTKKKP